MTLVSRPARARCNASSARLPRQFPSASCTGWQTCSIQRSSLSGCADRKCSSTPDRCPITLLRATIIAYRQNRCRRGRVQPWTSLCSTPRHLPSQQLRRDGRITCRPGRTTCRSGRQPRGIVVGTNHLLSLPHLQGAALTIRWRRGRSLPRTRSSVHHSPTAQTIRRKEVYQ